MSKCDFTSSGQVFTLFLALVQEMQHPHSPPNKNENEDANSDGVSRSKTTNSSNVNYVRTTKPPKLLKDPKCSNLETFTIYPNDSSRVVRKKQGKSWRLKAVFTNFKFNTLKEDWITF